jgi:hypothetical protein
MALQVLVRKKLPLRRLARGQRVPDRVEVSGDGFEGTVPTDVREVGWGRLESLASAKRPERPGFNVGHEQGGSGTLCCVVRTRAEQTRLGLSCAHVIGRFGEGQPGEEVLMPGRPEAEALDELAQAPIGRLATVAAIGFAVEDANTNIDAATFQPDNATDLNPRVALLSIRPRHVRGAVSLGLAVRKVGYASELTHGTVQALHVLASFPFPTQQGDRDVWFGEQIGISRFAIEGDSGSLVLDQAGRAIGMHIGSFQNLSVCTPIGRVLDAMSCDLDGAR